VDASTRTWPEDGTVGLAPNGVLLSRRSVERGIENLAAPIRDAIVGGALSFTAD
jgi:hypothetical protein